MADCLSGFTLSKTFSRCCEELCEKSPKFNMVDCCSSNCSKNYSVVCDIYFSRSPKLDLTNGISQKSSTPIDQHKTTVAAHRSNIALKSQAFLNNGFQNTSRRTKVPFQKPSTFYKSSRSSVNPILQDAQASSSISYIASNVENKDRSMEPLLIAVISFLVFASIVIICNVFRRYCKNMFSHKGSRSMNIRSAAAHSKQMCLAKSNALNFAEYECQTSSLIDICHSSINKHSQVDENGIRGVLKQFSEHLCPVKEVDPKNIVVFGELGKGNYGVVSRGILLNNTLNNSSIDVAIKEIYEDAPNREVLLYCLKLEVRALQLVGVHANVINLIGVVTQPSLALITEFCKFGDLKSFIRAASAENRMELIYDTIDELSSLLDHNLITSSALLMYAVQIANGAEYLSQKTLVHRDLALRNMLLNAEHVVKISDFGLVVKSDQDYQVYYRQELPTRWLPPELLKRDRGKITTVSDIWSFGVVLWELFSLAKSPCEVPAPMSKDQFYIWLEKGNRFPQPEFASEKIYELMNKCWTFNPGRRPSFLDCRSQLARYLNERSLDMYNYILTKININVENICTTIIQSIQQ